ncbi:MAG: hypothetical protein WBN92_09600 [Terriglobia bacterium]
MNSHFGTPLQARGLSSAPSVMLISFPFVLEYGGCDDRACTLPGRDSGSPVLYYSRYS